MRIRHATRADLDQIVAIYNATIPDRMATADLVPVSVEEREAWYARHTPDRRPIWVAEGKPEQVIAWGSLTDFYGRPAYDATAEISVYVAAPHRRGGTGRALLEHAIAEAPRVGVRTLLALIFAHNEASLRLFDRCGFDRWGVLEEVADLDDVRASVVILGRRL